MGAMIMTDIHSISLEQSILCLIMSVDKSLDRLTVKPVAADFYAERHKAIFNAITSLFDRGAPYDPLSVKTELESQATLIQAGEESYLMELMGSGGVASSLPEYIAKAKKYTQHRAIEAAALEIARQARAIATENLGQHSLDLLNRAMIGDMTASKMVQLGEACDAALHDALMKAQARFDGIAPNVINTGFQELDNKIGDIENGNLIIIAARPAMGKTTLMLNIAQNVSLGTGVPCLIASLEMSNKELAQRTMSAIADIPLNQIRSGMIGGDNLPILAHKMDAVLRKSAIELVDVAGMTVPDLAQHARAVKAKYGTIGAIFVDYLQLLRDPKAKGRFDEISEISRNLKRLAKDMNCPVFALSQLNRGLESRPNKRPVLSDLRESGQIEQDADAILFVYRDEVYNPNSESQGVAEVITGKSRHSGLSTVRLLSRLDVCRFDNLVGGYE